MSKRIVIHCADQINSSGPLSPDDLAPAAVAAGLTRSVGAVRSALRQSPVLFQLPDGRFDTVRRMLDGAVLTHRVRYATRGRQVLFAGPELALLDLLLVHEGSLPLASGDAITSSIGEFGGWCGPPDWLPDIRADSLLAFRFRSGRLSVAAMLEEPSSSGPATERLRVVLKRCLRSGDDLAPSQSHHTLSALMLRALAEVPELLHEPLPPLDEILQLGREHWGRDWLLDSGEPSDDPGFVRGGQRVVLEGLPSTLVSALRRDARNLGVSLGELTVLLLSAATYRTAMPCRHDAEEAWSSAPASRSALAGGLIESSHQ
jgi:hypothetical protein